MRLNLKKWFPRAGDLLGFAGTWTDAANVAIKLGTLSTLTHVAGVAEIDVRQLRAAASERVGRLGGHGDLFSRRLSEAALNWRDRPLLIESTTMCDFDCAIAHRRTRGVQAQEPLSRVGAYRGRVFLYRPTRDWPIDAEKSERLTRFLLPRLGDAYDLAGAFASASRVLKSRWWYYPANGHALFCSALWDEALQQIGFLAPEDYSVVNPAQLLRALVKVGRYECWGEMVR